MHPAEAVSAMLCPVCTISLARSDRQGIEIDQCPQCRGIWLDRGELDKIIARNRPDIMPSPLPVPPRQARMPWGEDRYLDSRYPDGMMTEQRASRRRRSWLEQILG